MPSKSVTSSDDNRSSLSVQEKPLVFTQTTTTTTTKHFEFDNKTVNFDDIKALFDHNGAIAKAGNKSGVPRTSFVKPLAPAPRKRALSDIQNRKSKQLTNTQRQSQWTICDENNVAAGPSTIDENIIDNNIADLLEAVEANGQQPYQKPKNKNQRLTETRTTILNVESSLGNRLNNLKMSRINNISVLPWEQLNTQSSPVVVVANGNRIRGTPLKANSPMPKPNMDKGL